MSFDTSFDSPITIINLSQIARPTPSQTLTHMHQTENFYTHPDTQIDTNLNPQSNST